MLWKSRNQSTVNALKPFEGSRILAEKSLVGLGCAWTIQRTKEKFGVLTDLCLKVS